MGCIEDAANIRRCRNMIEAYEWPTGNLVYHVIEAKNGLFGPTISFLYVGSDPDEWDQQRPVENPCTAFICNMQNFHCVDGKVFLAGNNGALERIYV